MCEHTTYTRLQVNQYDPTRTLTLRTAFVRDVDRRFRDLIKVIREAVVEQDCFGLTVQTFAEVTAPGYQQFAYPRTSQKVEAFMEWLRTQQEKGLLEIRFAPQYGSSIEEAWTNMYIWDSYKRGVIRARSEMKKAGYDVPTIEATGGIDVVMQGPFHIDRVGVLFTRAFEEMKGITAAMDTQISRVLAQGLIDGDGAMMIARKLVATINGAGMGELGITDSIGRFIPAQRRAQTMARTEIIRAHHMGNVQSYKNWGVMGVTVTAEWSTAGDERVCDECASLEGNVYTLQEIEHMIPRHPNCRCIAMPIIKQTQNITETGTLSELL